MLTSGGTESLMNPLLVYREWGRERGITQPNVVLPTSAHPAFHKGAHYFGIELRLAPVTDQFVADVAAMRDLVDDNTVALLATAGLLEPAASRITSLPSIGVGVWAKAMLARPAAPLTPTRSANRTIVLT